MSSFTGRETLPPISLILSYIHVFMRVQHNFFLHFQINLITSHKPLSKFISPTINKIDNSPSSHVDKWKPRNKKIKTWHIHHFVKLILLNKNTETILNIITNPPYCTHLNLYTLWATFRTLFHESTNILLSIVAKFSVYKLILSAPFVKQIALVR